MKCFQVNIKPPYDQLATSLLMDFIYDAISSWAGGLEPPNKANNFKGDPLWGLSAKHVVVRSIPKDKETAS